MEGRRGWARVPHAKRAAPCGVRGTPGPPYTEPSSRLSPVPQLSKGLAALRHLAVAGPRVEIWDIPDCLSKLRRIFRNRVNGIVNGTSLVPGPGQSPVFGPNQGGLGQRGRVIAAPFCHAAAGRGWSEVTVRRRCREALGARLSGRPWRRSCGPASAAPERPS